MPVMDFKLTLQSFFLLLLVGMTCGMVRPADAQIQHSDRIEPGDSVTRTETRFGPVTVVSKAEMDDDYNYRTPVLFGGQKLKLPGYGGAVEAHFILSSEDILVIRTQGGARGVPPDYHLLRLDHSGLTNVSDGTDFGTADFTFRAEQEGNTIRFDLGFQGGRRQSAIYRNGNLQIISVQSTAKGRLSRDDCAFVLNAFDLCRQYRDSCDEPSDMFSMNIVRGLAAISNNPSFSQEKFKRFCREVCVLGRFNVKSVRKELCGY